MVEITVKRGRTPTLRVGIHVIVSVEDIRQLPTETLLELHNHFAGNALQRFKTRAQGIAVTAPLVSRALAEAFQARLPRENSFNMPPRPPLNVRGRHRSKRRRLLADLLGDGLTFQEIMAKYEWTVKDAYEGTRALNKFLGYGLRQDPVTKRITAYTE